MWLPTGEYPLEGCAAKALLGQRIVPSATVLSGVTELRLARIIYCCTAPIFYDQLPAIRESASPWWHLL